MGGGERERERERIPVVIGDDFDVRRMEAPQHLADSSPLSTASGALCHYCNLLFISIAHAARPDLGENFRLGGEK